MVNLFKKDESIKPYGGYKLTFYPDEFVLPGGKTKQLLHIHVIGQEGEIRVYLLIKEKSNLYIETKRGNIPQHKQRKIKDFINDYYDLIITRVKKELKKEINREIKLGVKGANFSQPKIIACQTNKEKLTAELDDGRKVNIKAEQLKNYEIWNEGSNIYFPDIDEILPARVLSKGLFSSCDEDMDTNVDEEKKEAANDTNFIRMFVEIRAEEWKEVVLIFNEKVISKKDIGHITNKLIPTSYLENNFLAILLNRKDAGLNIQARNLCRDNEGDGIIVGVNYKNVYACIIEMINYVKNAIDEKDNTAEKVVVPIIVGYADEVIDFLNAESSDDRNRGTGQNTGETTLATAPQLLTLDEVEGWNNVKSALDGSGFNADKKQIIARVNDYLNNISPEYRDLVKQKKEKLAIEVEHGELVLKLVWMRPEITLLILLTGDFKAASAFVGAYNDMEDDDILDYRKSGGNRRATGAEGAIARNGVWNGFGWSDNTNINADKTQIIEYVNDYLDNVIPNQYREQIRKTVDGDAFQNAFINTFTDEDYEVPSSDSWILDFLKTNGGHTITPQQAATIVGGDWRRNWKAREIRINNDGTIRGGNVLDANLTATNAHAADIQINGTDIRVVNPLTGNNVDGFAAIDALGDKAVLTAAAAVRQKFITDFKAVSGASASASDPDILAYFDKNLTAEKAAELYNGNPRVDGSELEKGTTNNKVKYDNKEYDADKPADIAAAKKAKIDADEAAKLSSAKTNAISAIQTLMDDTSDYINAATTETEVSNRQDKIKKAIKEIRKTKEPPFDAAAARLRAITEKEFEDKNTQTDIDNKKVELTGKIDAEKAKEPKESSRKVSAEEVKKVFETITGESNVEVPNEIENIKEGEKADFSEYLSKLSATEQPTGSNEKEKVNDFLTHQKAEVVIKAIFGYKLKKDDNFVNEVKAKMEAEKNDEGQPLDQDVYPKQDDKYTQEAMIKYLFQKKTGQAHQFAAKQQNKYKYLYGLLTVLLLAAGLVVIFWERLTGSVEGGKNNA
ncbi:11134_t:CDS:10 [Racocetra fulgida]|uniref:11134_t:CDS:1 n=1 Tax=Racocetra fulgida TaxID=60492 RepID=A0A9N9CYW6_9GLOM|nr:11134_t:CDS:10 [Racocetra fulgida]